MHPQVTNPLHQIWHLPCAVSHRLEDHLPDEFLRQEKGTNQVVDETKNEDSENKNSILN